MASLFTFDQLPATSQDAIQQFDERWLMAVSAAPASAWGSQFVMPSPSPSMRFPLTAMAAAFRETIDFSGVAKTLREGELSLSVVEFDEGYEAKLLDILTNTFAYSQWGQAASELARAESQLVNDKLAALIEAGTSTVTQWDNVNFFSTAHLANPFDASITTTWSNYQSTTKDPANEANLIAEITAMKDVRGPNGKKLGLQPTAIYVPTEKHAAVDSFLAKQFLASGESNSMFGKLRAVELPELTDTNDWYLVDEAAMARLAPMVAMKYSPGNGLELRSFDESSDFFKQTSKIRVSRHVWYGFSLLFPHAIRKIAGA